MGDLVAQRLSRRFMEETMVLSALTGLQLCRRQEAQSLQSRIFAWMCCPWLWMPASSLLETKPKILPIEPAAANREGTKSPWPISVQSFCQIHSAYHVSGHVD